MLPGKQYKPEDFLEIAWRRRWLIVVPLVLLSIGAFVYAQRLPNRYRATATVLIVPPRVPGSLVKPMVTSGVQARLQALRQRILSRTQLERIMQDLDLYREERKSMLPETVIAMMARDIGMNVQRPTGRRASPGAFTISYVSPSPKTAALVTDRLASLFVNANLEDRELQATSTSQFMKAQVDDAKKRLLDVEKRIEDYKRTYAGQLPSQVSSNVNVMQSMQSQLQKLEEQINADRDRILSLEKQVADAEAAAVVEDGGTGGSDVPANAPASRRLEAARVALRNLEMRGLQPDHPDVAAMKRTIRDLEVKAEAEALQQPLGSAAVGVSKAESTRRANINRMRNEIESAQRRIAANQDRASRLQQQVGSYRARIEASPTRESEMAQLLREQEAAASTYGELSKKLEVSEQAAELEQRQVGEQFRVLESARTPERPFSPNRVRTTLLGLAAGLALGLVLAGLVEYRDTSLRTEDDVILTLSLPVVALVPTMTTGAERRRTRTRRLILATSTAVALLVSVVALVWKLRLFETWSR